MLDFLYGSVLLPAYETGIKRRKTYRYWRDLERTQWMSPAELRQFQFEALRRLVTHAHEHCPYYREAWEQAGLSPARLQGPDDFQRWPVIDRDAIRAHRMRMRSTAPGIRLLSKSTGGSSGTPLHFDLDTDSNDRRTAAWNRGYGWAGGAPGTKQLYLWSITLTPRARWKQWKDNFYNALYRRCLLNTFGVSDENTTRYLDRLNRYRPKVIVAYAHSLYVFARALAERGLKPFSPRSIIVGAEKLHPFQRELIQQVFQAPVFETYGSREVMLMGAECDRHEGMHLTVDNLLIEVLDDDGRPTPDGQEGNVVVTDLYNVGMPFVRYANGDRAVAGWRTCSCGRGLPLLQEVVGRRSDMVHTPDGRHISGVFFPHLMKDFPAVKHFLVVQDRPDHLDIHLVVDSRWDDQSRDLLEASLRKGIGPTMELGLRTVDRIPLTLAGKHRVVLNLCDGLAVDRLQGVC
jgi:phenylacetate-CoA ligase